MISLDSPAQPRGRQAHGMSDSRTLVALVGTLLGALALGGCRGQVTQDTPVVPIRNMYDQPRYDSQERSEFFSDHRTMRPQVDGTVSQEMEPDLSTATGRLPDNAGWVLTTPRTVVQRNGGPQAFIERGQGRFNIYCTPCHGVAGDAQGVVPNRAIEVSPNFATIRPPTFHDDAIRQMPDGQVFATITNGIRNMPAYSQNIPVDDRWAIVNYVRALQLAQPNCAE